MVKMALLDALKNEGLMESPVRGHHVLVANEKQRPRGSPRSQRSRHGVIKAGLQSRWRLRI